MVVARQDSLSNNLCLNNFKVNYVVHNNIHLLLNCYIRLIVGNVIVILGVAMGTGSA